MAVRKLTEADKKWAKSIKDRDGKCKNCGTLRMLHAHHIIPYRLNETLRLDLDNGMTLCASCHAKIEGFRKGHTLSQQQKEKLSASLKGKIPWIAGKKHTEETKKKMSIAKIGFTPHNKGHKTPIGEYRVCKICSIEKSINEFTPCQRGYVSRRCKECRNAQLKASWNDRKEKINAHRKELRKKRSQNNLWQQETQSTQIVLA